MNRLQTSRVWLNCCPAEVMFSIYEEFSEFLFYMYEVLVGLNIVFWLIQISVFADNKLRLLLILISNRLPVT